MQHDFYAARATGYIDAAPGLLEPPIVRHRPGVTDPRRLGVLLRAIEGYAGREIIGIALRLALLFFVRPGELRKARWEQFDFERAQWRIPARCMKASVQHLVPFSRQALELLRKLQSLTADSEYLFPLIRDAGRPLHGTALSSAPQSLGFDREEVTPHGFRATACTLLNELGWRSRRSNDRWRTGSQTPSGATITTRSISPSGAPDAGLGRLPGRSTLGAR